MASPSSDPVEAIVFDLGGVVLGSPLAGIADFERANNIPLGFVNVNVVSRGESGAFQRLERGETSMGEFYRAFREELEDPEQLQTFADFVKVPRNQLPERLVVDTVELFRVMMERSMWADGDFVHAIYTLRGIGLKVGALTNNFAPMNSSAPGSINMHALIDLFDHVVESAVEGVRKPDPKAFLLTCEKLQADPRRSVMMDDIGLNLKGAKKVGMETIQVKLKDKHEALRQLEEIILRRNKIKVRLAYDERGVTDFTKISPQRLFWNVGTDKSPRLIVGDAFGHGANPPVIFLHGGGQNRHSWGSTCRILATKGFFAISLDLKGHGESYWDPDAAYKPEAIAKDLDALVKKMGLDNRAPLLVGASLGGLTILMSEIAISKNKCSGVCLVDVTPRLEAGGVNRVIGFMEDSMRKGFDTLEEAAQAIRDYQPHRKRDTVNPEGLKKNLVWNEGRKKWVFHWDPSFLEGTIANSQEVLDQFEAMALSRASSISVPVMLIKGKLTDIVSDEGVMSLKRAVPGALVRDVHDAGHMIAGDQNDAFTDELLAFAESLKSRMSDASLALIPEGDSLDRRGAPPSSSSRSKAKL